MKTKNTIKYVVISILIGFVAQVSLAQATAVSKEEIIDLVNLEREKLGLNQLLENETLDKAAMLKAQDMIGNNYFAHTSPSGVDPWFWFDKAGYFYKYAGENLAMDFSSAESVHRAWMKSKTHQENIVSKKFQEIGVAVLSGIMEGRETQVAVQLFGTGLTLKEIENNEKIEKIKGEFGNSIEVKISKASLSPWEGSFEDEMLVFTEISGKPQKVELSVNEELYPLEELRDGMYMNLVSLKKINLAQDQLIIKATINDETAVFYQVPKSGFDEYLAKKESDGKEDDGDEIFAMTSITRDEGLSEMLYPFSPNNLLVVIMGVFLVTVANVWVLEKEEEKLLSEVKPS